MKSSHQVRNDIRTLNTHNDRVREADVAVFCCSGHTLTAAAEGRAA